MRVQYHDRRVPRYATEREAQAKYETGLSGTQASGRVVFGGIEPRPDGGLFRNASYRALLVFLRKRDERFDDSVGNLSIAVSRFSVCVVACGARPSPTNLGGRCSRAFHRPLSGRGVRAGSRRVRNYETKPSVVGGLSFPMLPGCNSAPYSTRSIRGQGTGAITTGLAVVRQPTVSGPHILNHLRLLHKAFTASKGTPKASAREPVQAIQPGGLLSGLVGEIQARAAREPAPAGRHI